MSINSLQSGHRQRLRDRLLRGGEAALADYELLEMGLFLSQPRGDVKPLAKELLKQFGSLTGVFQAPLEELKQLKGVGDSVAATLRMVHAITMRIAQEDILKRPILSGSEQLVRYCRLRIQNMKIEQFHVFFLDKKKQFIADEIHQKGTIDRATVYPRELIKQALYHGASHMLLVHNHPSGDCTPSQADIELTKYLEEVGSKLGIRIQDHLVVSASNHVSMKEKGLF